MNREMSDRIMTAKAYQKKAILALLPEEMSGHLEMIEKELKLMAGELLQAVLNEGGRNGEGEGVNPEVRTVRNTRKIEIV